MPVGPYPLSILAFTSAVSPNTAPGSPPNTMVSWEKKNKALTAQGARRGDPTPSDTGVRRWHAAFLKVVS